MASITEEMESIIAENTALKKQVASMETQLSEKVAKMRDEFILVQKEYEKNYKTLLNINQENVYALDRTDSTGWSPSGEQWKIQRNLERYKNLMEKAVNSTKDLHHCGKKIEAYQTWLDDASHQAQLADLMNLLNTGDALRNARAEEQDIALQKANQQLEWANPDLFRMADLTEDLASEEAYSDELFKKVHALRNEVDELRKKLGEL
jgi:hypothetical protein